MEEEFQLTGGEAEVEEKKKPNRALPPPVADAKRRQRAAEEEQLLAWIDICIAENDLKKAQERLERAKRDHLVATNDLRRMGTNGNKSPVRRYNREQKKAQASLAGIPHD